jgi:hypothetical protein
MGMFIHIVQNLLMGNILTVTFMKKSVYDKILPILFGPFIKRPINERGKIGAIPMTFPMLAINK